jgi:hypothetical protein
MALNETYLAKLLAIGLAAVTIFVYTSSVSDPVNTPKFFLLGIVASATLANLSLKRVMGTFKSNKIAFFLILIIVMAMLNAVIFSDSPLVQNLYGTQGRNTGMLTFLACCILFISVLTMRSTRSASIILNGLLMAGIVNILYSAWVLIFGDFIPWNNQYKSILGTFGNPNFVSAFIAISVTAFMPILFSRRKNLVYLFIGIVTIILAIYEIWKSNSIQGLIIILLGLALGCISILYYIGAPRYVLWLISMSAVISTTLASIGALGKGPFGAFLFQETFAYRVEYWRAGINMGLKFPLSGVGMDSYGDWYRSLRTDQSLITPGVEVITNVAHNIYIDYFASGGFPLLMPVLAIQLITVISIVKVLKMKKEFDPIFLGIVFAWVGFQAQAIISINQIGIAIWGWALSGLIIGYANILTGEKPKSDVKRTANRQYIGNGLKTFVGSVAGALIFLPPLSSDHNWTSAYASRDASKIRDSLAPSYFNPPNSYTLATAIQIFENSGLNQASLEIARQSTLFNPRSYDAWNLLKSLKLASEDDKRRAHKNIVKLDPRIAPSETSSP